MSKAKSARIAPLTWSRCRAGKESPLGRRQIWAGTDRDGLLCASIERFPELGSRCFMVILDLVIANPAVIGEDEQPLVQSCVMAAKRSLKRAKAAAARLVARTENLKKYEKPASNRQVN